MITVTTNHHLRPTIDAWELTAAEREEFDHLDWPAIERGEDSATFVRYKGELADLGDVMLATGRIKEMGWDGFNSDTFFSGTAYRYVRRDGEDWVVVGYVYASDD